MSFSILRLAATTAALLAAASASAQQPVGAPVALIEDLVAANHVLARENVVDAYGHISVRSPANPQHFYMSRALAPSRVTAEDIMEFDGDGNPVDAQGRHPYLERFIHAEVYKANPAVNAVVHSHSPGVIPFGVTDLKLRAVQHTASFLGADGPPVFDIAQKFGATNLLVNDAAKGKALADVLGAHSVALMRGHGDVVVGPNIPTVVSRAIYTEKNARTLLATIPLGRPITYLSPDEVAIRSREKSTETRDWDLWKAEATGTR